MSFVQRLAYIKEVFEANYPTLLAAVGATPIDDFLDKIPTNEKRRQVCVYLDKGDDDRYNSEDGFIVQIQLPGELTPAKYLDPALEVIRKNIDPSEMGYLSRDLIEWDVLYSGKPPLGGFGSFIYINLSYKQSYDDC